MSHVASWRASQLSKLGIDDSTFFNKFSEYQVSGGGMQNSSNEGAGVG
jgi:hypothetical protein